jgi:hypothetical protein
MNTKTLALNAVFVGIVITFSVAYAATTDDHIQNGISSFSIKTDQHRRHSRRGEILRQRRVQEKAQEEMQEKAQREMQEEAQGET